MSKVAQVIVKLKPKVASLGFNRMEIEGVASRIANNLGDDATEEDIDAEIDAVMPYLELAQTSASRIINKSKDGDGNKSNTATGESKKTEKPSDKEGEQANEKDESTGAINLKNMDDLKKLLGGIVSKTLSPIAKRLEAIEGSKIADTRLSQVKEIAKKAGGSYEKTLLKNFGRMTFESDDDFAEYLTEITADVDSYVQENSNEGLKNSPKPKGGSSEGSKTLDPALQERISERKAETAAPAIAGLPTNQ